MTSEMMFYLKASLAKEEKIRQEGLARMRRKVFEKIQQTRQQTLPSRSDCWSTY